MTDYHPITDADTTAFGRWRFLPARVSLITASLALAGLTAAVAPLWYGLGIAAAVAGAAALIVLRLPVAVTGAWLMAIATMPDMWAGDIFGGGANAIVGGVKVLGYALVVIIACRTGLRADPFNPGLAFLAMAAIGWVHGFHPRLDVTESVRSVLGSVAPFAFGFVAGSRPWADTVIWATRWGPLAATGFGAALGATGLHPLFIESGGARLAGSGHPAFLAGFAMTAVYACLTELFRTGRARDLALLIANLLILVLTGARAPLAIAGVVLAITFIAVRAKRFGWARRAPLMLGGLIAIAAILPLASALSSVRLFSILEADAENLSGRDQIWPFFQDAWAHSPVWGWGVGAGKVLVPEDSLTAKLLGTTAAHNEYLRIGVDGGYVGLALLGLLLALWTWWLTRRAPLVDRAVVRMAMAGFYLHARTDNVLIATTAVTLFAWMTAIGMRARLDAAPGEGVSAGL